MQGLSPPEENYSFMRSYNYTLFCLSVSDCTQEVITKAERVYAQRERKNTSTDGNVPKIDDMNLQ